MLKVNKSIEGNFMLWGVATFLFFSKLLEWVQFELTMGMAKF